MTECESCKAERLAKGLAPMERLKLSRALTPASSFRRPGVATYACAYCDGDLVPNALRNLQERQGK